MINNKNPFTRRFNEFILDRYNYHARCMFNKAEINNFPEVVITENLEHVVVNLLLNVMGKKQQKKITLKTPKTWFNWMKMKYRKSKWMKWIINRYPIKYKTNYFTLNKYTTFPNLKLPKELKNRLHIVYYDIDEN